MNPDLHKSYYFYFLLVHLKLPQTFTNLSQFQLFIHYYPFYYNIFYQNNGLNYILENFNYFRSLINFFYSKTFLIILIILLNNFNHLHSK
jgi:hypothetical protein